MKNKKLFAILTLVCFMFTLMPVAAMAEEAGDNAGKQVATVNGVPYTDLQEAIKVAAPDGTVEIINDVTVDEWVMFAESLSIGNGNLITLKIDGLTINGNNHTLTINSVESAGNGAKLFHDATNLNINKLEINQSDDVCGIALQSGTISEVTINGGAYGIHPGNGKITIEGCTFKTNGTAIYYEEERDNLTVTENTFELGENTNVILLRGDTEFTNNTIVSGRTVNVVSGSPVVSGNDFGDVRFKVYNSATATIEDNEINVLEFNDATTVNSAFFDNTLSDDAKGKIESAGALAVAKVDNNCYKSLADAVENADDKTVTLLEDVTLTETVTIPADKTVTLDLNGKTVNYSSNIDDADLLINKGDLTITDSSTNADGKLSFTYTGTSNAKSTSTIVNIPGATLNIAAGTIENKTAIDNGSYAYAIDSQTNGNNGNVVVNVTGGNIVSNYMAIRQCVNGTACDNTLNVTDGVISGVKRAINVQDLKYAGGQDKSNVNDKAVTNITGGVISSPDGYAVCIYGMTNNLSITNGSFDGWVFDYGAYYGVTKGFISGGTYSTAPDEVYLAEGYVNMENADGTYSPELSTASDFAGIALGKNATSIKVGNTETLVVESVIAGATVVWTSSDETVATVKDGVVTALKAGDVTITASIVVDGKTYKADCVVNVYKSVSSSGGGFSGAYNYPVTVSATGADVTLSDNYAVKGETVTITIDPDMGKKVDEVIVTDKDGNVISVTKVGDNKYTFVMPEGKVNVSVTTEDADYDQRIVMQINNKNIVVNNRTITNDVSPVIVGDRTLVPVRIVTELLGGTADWDEATRTVTLTIDGKVLKLVIGKDIPGFGTSATIINDRTYVPVRYVLENLGAEVTWIGETQQIVIEK